MASHPLSYLPCMFTCTHDPPASHTLILLCYHMHALKIVTLTGNSFNMVWPPTSSSPIFPPCNIYIKMLLTFRSAIHTLLQVPHFTLCGLTLSLSHPLYVYTPIGASNLPCFALHILIVILSPVPHFTWCGPTCLHVHRASTSHTFTLTTPQIPPIKKHYHTEPFLSPATRYRISQVFLGLQKAPTCNIVFTWLCR